MPPNLAVMPDATPDSLADKENSPLALIVRSPKYPSKLPQTEPRPLKPLQVKDTNRTTPTDIRAVYQLKSISAPPASKKNPIKTSKANEHSDVTGPMEQVLRMKRPTLKLTNEKSAKRIAAGGERERGEFKYASSRDGAVAIAEKLGIEGIPEEITTPTDLFEHLERSGRLSPTVMKLYAHCPGIKAITMGPTYGGEVNEIGLLEEGKLPTVNCTVPFFHGYTELRALDFTCVPIMDEDLRYLIRLNNLQALGLSGTKVTGRGLRYLTKHAQFTTTLQCIKLCYLEKLDDSGLIELKKFPGLLEVDLFGSGKISLKAILKLLPLVPGQCTLTKLRPPEKVVGQLKSLHLTYHNMPDLEYDPERIDQMSDNQVKLQLRRHQKHYPDVFLNLAIESLREKLRQILILRRKEEFLWSIYQ